MILTLDMVAQRYGILPSRLLVEGSSLDIVIADAAQGFTNQKQEEARARQEGRVYVKPAKPLSEKQMQDMIDKVKKHAN